LITAGSTTTTTIYGIRKGGSATGTINSDGIATVSNNIVYINDSRTNTVYGISENGVAGAATNVYYNTVYIAGTSSSSSYAFYSKQNVNNRDFRNNIFVNTRSGGTDKHYAAFLAYSTMATSPVTFTSDYNNYYVTGTGGVLGNAGGNKTTLANFALATGGDANSKSETPGITPGTTPESFRMTAALFAATGTSITTDYAGNTRSSSPSMGAYELPYWNGTGWVGGDPTSTMSAVIDGNFSGAGFSCLDLIVNPAKQLTISSGTLSVTGNLTLKSSATYKPEGTGVLVVNGTTNVEQTLSAGRQWWYLSSPLSAASSDVFSGDQIGKHVENYIEDPDNGLTTAPYYTSPFSTPETMTPGRGYVVKRASTAEQTYTFTGGSLNTGNISATVTRTGTSAPKRGFNLVGNPYPSYIDWDAIHAETSNMRDAVWFRTDDSGMKFHTYGDADGVPEVTSSKIAPMQAFWVKVAADGSNGTLTFKDAHRSHFTDGANLLKVKANELRPRLRLVISNGAAKDETLIVGKSYASNLLDSYDIEKMSADNTSIPELFSLVQNQEMVINSMQELSDGKLVQLGFRPGQAGNYTLEVTQLENIDAKAILVDHLTSSQTELQAGTTYSFSSDATATNSRFSIEFRAPGATTSVNEVNASNTLVYVTDANQIAVQSAALTKADRISVYNLAGQQLAMQNVEGQNTILSQPFSAGVYLVKVNNHLQKVIVQ